MTPEIVFVISLITLGFILFVIELFSIDITAMILLTVLFVSGVGGFRKLREACRRNFHLVAPLKTSVVTTYDQQTKLFNNY